MGSALFRLAPAGCGGFAADLLTLLSRECAGAGFPADQASVLANFALALRCEFFRSGSAPFRSYGLQMLLQRD